MKKEALSDSCFFHPERAGSISIRLFLFVTGLILVLAGPLFAQNQSPLQFHPADTWPAGGWQSSSPEAQGLDSGILAEAFDYIRERQIPIHSLLIVRNGRIVLDAYFYPFQAGQLHDLASVTKSVTSTLIGIAIGQNQLQGLQQPVLTLFPHKNVAHRDPQKERMTIESLLCMESGLDCHFQPREITLSEMMGSKDWIQFMLDLPMTSEPGSHYEYCSGGMHLLSGIITQATGLSALQYARKELFQPLGIEEVIWPADPREINHGWGDLHLRPRDMAKIGFLWLNRGRWENRQLIPQEWMQAAIQAHSRSPWGQDYGYGFWPHPKRRIFTARLTCLHSSSQNAVAFQMGLEDNSNLGINISQATGLFLLHLVIRRLLRHALRLNNGYLLCPRIAGDSFL